MIFLLMIYAWKRDVEASPERSELLNIRFIHGIGLQEAEAGVTVNNLMTPELLLCCLRLRIQSSERDQQ